MVWCGGLGKRLFFFSPLYHPLLLRQQKVVSYPARECCRTYRYEGKLKEEGLPILSLSALEVGPLEPAALNSMADSTLEGSHLRFRLGL